MNKYVKIIIVLVVCAAALSGVFLFVKISKAGGGMPGMPGGKKGGGFGGGAPAVVSVKTMIAEKSVLHDYVNTNGEIETQTSVDVFPDIGGKVVSMKVSLGTYVKKGQVIAEIDPSKPGAQYAKSPVLAPISGTVTSCSVKTGKTVSTSTTIAVIGDVSNLQVVANIPERYVATLKPGLKGKLILEAYPDLVFTATVTRVSPVVDSARRTKEIILNFDEIDSRINAGMFAKLTLYTQDYTDAIVVPSNSIVMLNGQKCVYVVKGDNTAEKRIIETGNSVDANVQILSGLSEGDRVVIEGMRVLGDGSAVREVGSSFAGNAAPAGAPAKDSEGIPADVPDGKPAGDKKDGKKPGARSAK